MRGATLIAAASLAALGLAACQEGGAGKGAAGGLCKPFAAAPAGSAPGSDGAAVVDDCLHRWSYTLAKSEDAAGLVAQAAMAACAAPITRWNQQALTAAAASGARVTEAPSLLTGETTNPIAEHNNFAEGRALFYVVQARAGKCAPPPAREASAPTTSDAAARNSPDR